MGTAAPLAGPLHGRYDTWGSLAPHTALCKADHPVYSKAVCSTETVHCWIYYTHPWFYQAEGAHCWSCRQVQSPAHSGTSNEPTHTDSVTPLVIMYCDWSSLWHKMKLWAQVAGFSGCLPSRVRGEKNSWSECQSTAKYIMNTKIRWLVTVINKHVRFLVWLRLSGLWYPPCHIIH